MQYLQNVITIIFNILWFDIVNHIYFDRLKFDAKVYKNNNMMYVSKFISRPLIRAYLILQNAYHI